MWMYLVFETGQTEVKKIKQAVDLWHRQVWHPSLQQPCVCILQHPQETNQQRLAALSREGATLTARLTEKQTQTHLQYTNTLTQKNTTKPGLIRHHIRQPVWDRLIQRMSTPYTPMCIINTQTHMTLIFSAIRLPLIFTNGQETV